MTSNLYYFAKNDSWISVLIAVAASLVIIAIYSALAKRYPGKSLQEISEAVFGRSIGKAVSVPTFSSIRLIDVGDILTRLEVVYAVILMMMLFCKVGIVYYATVSGISRLFNIGSHQSFIFILGGIIAVYAAASFPAKAEHVEWNLTAAATYSSFFLLVLPAVTLAVASLRGRNNSETAAGRNTG